MPLKKGCTPEIISYNVRQSMREGKKRSQAVAIAYSQCKGKKNGKK